MRSSPRPTPRHGLAAALVALTLLIPTPALARMPRMPDDQMAAMANLIVEAQVVSTRLEGASVRGTQARGIFSSQLGITRVIKGAKKAGDVIKVSWFTVRWVGMGPQPSGHYAYPAFYPCERVHVYLDGKGAVYFPVAWSAKRSIKPPPKYVSPLVKGQVARCDGGKVIVDPPPAGAQAAAMSGAMSMAGSQTSVPKKTTSTKRGCGCQNSAGAGAPAMPLAGVVLLFLWAIRRRWGARRRAEA